MSNPRSVTGRRGVSIQISTSQAILLALEEINTPKSLAAAIMLRYAQKRSGNLQQYNELMQGYMNLEFDPQHYDLYVTGGGSFKRLADRISLDYQAVKLASKLDIDIGIDREQRALTRFLEAEAECNRTNWRFSHSGLVSASQDASSARSLEICFRAKKIVREILGKCDLDAVVNSAGFGPGVTLEARNRPILPAKISSCQVFSPGSWRLLSHVIGASPLMFEAATGIKTDGPCCTIGNQVHEDDFLTFVNKNWKTKRTIRISSGASIYIQKGVGSLIRKRLKRVGVDLDDQTINQGFAEQASRRGDLATVDLESASDSISRGLVRFLLPEEWLELLESVRTKYTILPDGTRHFLSGFSGMGNGYTFELESLLFYALTCAFYAYHDVPTHEISVYGDDIVCPATFHKEFVDFMAFSGFKLNREKTYVDGYFRESCGKDFVYGYDVRPFFLKERIDHLEDYFKLANQIRAWNGRRSNYCGTRTLRRLSGSIYHAIDPRYRLRVPPSFPGDSGFHTDEPLERQKRSNGFDGWYVKYYAVKSERKFDDTVGALAARLMVFKPSDAFGLSPLTDRGNQFSRRVRGRARRTRKLAYAICWI